MHLNIINAKGVMNKKESNHDNRKSKVIMCMRKIKI